MRKRLGVAVAALLLGAQIGSPASAAEPTIEQLTVISQYIERGDLESLIAFLAENPELMDGETVIAVRLREFMAAAEDMAAYLAFDPPMRAAMARQFFDDGDLFDGGRALDDGSQLAETPLDDGSELAEGPLDDDDPVDDGVAIY